jgi:MFS-type transporter involved in bile tolerance (Atg22 family)
VGLRKVFLWPVLFANIPIVVLLGFTMAAPLLILILISGLLSGFARPMPRVLILENERIGPMLAGTAFGGLATLGGIGAALLPALMGMVMDATGELWSGFVFLGVLAIIPALVILPIRETGRRARVALAEASSE